LGELDLNHAVAKIGRMLQRILGEDISLEIIYAPEQLFLNADSGMLDQILLNLAVNSRDAMPQGGKLLIQTSVWNANTAKLAPGQPTTGHYARLRVADTGSGIPPEILARIFEPFFTTKETGRGTGLGLATVHGIVQQHQGYIEVSSEVGKGTAFNIYLPLLPPKNLPPAVVADRTAMLGGTEAILIVEDEVTLRRLFRNILTRLGYRVFDAATGAAGLEVWRQNQGEIQLLLTDMVMPDGMTGVELARKLSAEKPGLPIIFISGYSPDIIGNQVDLQEGVNFLSKPFQMEKLAQIVRGRLDAARQAKLAPLTPPGRS
jgi:CheY-like chemotaxis protein